MPSGDAERIFTGIGGSYDALAAALSLWQDDRWRRALVSEIHAAPADRVLDVATGTGMVAEALVRRYRCRVVGLDQSADMLAVARRRDGVFSELVEGHAEALPFPDASFDHLTFTYLLRYVDDTATTMRELARVLRPGGRIAMVEFAVPPLPWRPLWSLYTRVGLPLLGRIVSSRWMSVGAFLGPSIESFYRAHPLPRIERYWRDAGLADVRVRRMSLGGGVVMSATKTSAPVTPTAPLAPAFYALRGGGWRDYWSLLHPPYTLWHLSYVALGAALAPHPDARVVGGMLLAFALAVGVGAHAFDELRGRPLRTGISARMLVALGSLGLAAALAIGVLAVPVVGPGVLLFVAAGGLLVLLYAFEAPLVHSDAGFALAWGAFPALTGFFVEAQTIRPSLELIVVDDGSTDPTSDVARAHGAIVVRHISNRGISAARNSGIHVASASIVAFLDDDCEPEPQWAEQLVVGYDENVLGLGGPLLVRADPGIVLNYLARHNPLDPQESDLAKSENLAYRLFLYMRRQWMPLQHHGRREHPAARRSGGGRGRAEGRVVTEPVYDVAHLGRVELFTPDLPASVEFFVDVLGMEVVERAGLARRVAQLRPLGVVKG